MLIRGYPIFHVQNILKIGRYFKKRYQNIQTLIKLSDFFFAVFLANKGHYDDSKDIPVLRHNFPKTKRVIDS